MKKLGILLITVALLVSSFTSCKVGTKLTTEESRAVYNSVNNGFNSDIADFTPSKDTSARALASATTEFTYGAATDALSADISMTVECGTTSKISFKSTFKFNNYKVTYTYTDAETSIEHSGVSIYNGQLYFFAEFVFVVMPVVSTSITVEYNQGTGLKATITDTPATGSPITINDADIVYSFKYVAKSDATGKMSYTYNANVNGNRVKETSKTEMKLPGFFGTTASASSR